MLTLALLIVAFILFVLAAIGVPAGRVSLLAAGAAAAVLALIVQAWP